MSEFNEKGLTSADMYDEDVKRICVVWNRIGQQYMRKPNDHFHVSEMAKRAQDELFKIGYNVRVHTAECLLGIGPATLEIIGRVPGHEFHKHGLDHDKKKWEVNKAVDAGVDKKMRNAIKAIEPPAR